MNPGIPTAASIRRLAFVENNPNIFGHNAIGKIRSVIFQDHQPDGIGARLDISDRQNGSVSAYLTRDYSTLYIGADGGINTGEHCSFLFDGLNAVEQIVFESNAFHTDGAKDFTHMFRNCKSLRSLDTGGFSTAKVKSFYGMFSGCDNLAALNLNGFDTSDSTDFTFMFSGCKSLEQLDISSFQIHLAVQWAKYFDESGDSVWFRVPPRIDGMFSDCESLTSLDLRSFRTCDVKGFTGMFENCRSLKTLLLGNGFIIRPDADTDRMFAGCESLDLSALPFELPQKGNRHPGML